MWKTRPEATGDGAGHLPSWRLEQLAFEPASAPAQAHRHLEACRGCGQAVARLGEAQRRFLAERPARPFVAAVLERAEGAGPRRARWPVAWRALRWLLAPAAVATALLLATPARHPDDGAVRTKGSGVTLRLFVARGGGAAHPLEPDMALRPGDVVRFGVISAAPRHAVVASVDEAGRFTRYVPAGPGEPARTAGGAELQLLPGSVELDETTGREWIVLVASPAPLDGEELRRALLAAWGARQGDRLGPLGLAAEIAVIPVAKIAP